MLGRRVDGYDPDMLASPLQNATRANPVARPARQAFCKRGVRFAAMLAPCAAVAISVWTLNARALAEDKPAAPPTPKAEAAQPARKTKEKMQQPAASASRPASPAPRATESGGGAQSRQRPAREEDGRKAPLAALPPPDTTRPPPRLPEAPRDKMRACALEWSKLKLQAHDPMPLWRDFGAQCLKR